MTNEITAGFFENMPESEYTVIDIRDKSAFEYGHIGNAINIPYKDILSAELPHDKKLIICCRNGIISRDIADNLCEKGFNAYNLADGYIGWLRNKMTDRQITEDVEKSLRKNSKNPYGANLQKL